MTRYKKNFRADGMPRMILRNINPAYNYQTKEVLFETSTAQTLMENMFFCEVNLNHLLGLF